MKTKYVNKATSKSRKVSNLNTEKKFQGDTTVFSDDSLNNALPTISKTIPRQKSNAIGTDNTGAAVRTINNILNGITNSVNRLSEIHSQMTDTPRPMCVTVALSPKPSKHDANDVMKNKSMDVLPSLAIDSCTLIKSRIKNQKRKIKNSSASSRNTKSNIKSSSKHTIKGNPNKVEKKNKHNTYSKSLMLEKRSSTFLKKRFFNKLTPNNLVEIYHNDAVKNSDSDEFQPKKGIVRQASATVQQNEVPPLEMELGSRKLPDNYPDGQQIQSRLRDEPRTSNKFFYEPPEAPRTLSCCYSRNYELPTVASKMKQVAKSYMGGFSFKTIPFCAATSITQSHNIGINIQQVMNIIKNRQSINGISPTLAHNIGLAADKLHNKPLTDIVSSINSRLGVTNSKCPLSIGCYNLQMLQEQAKTIQEEDIQEVEEENVESPQINTVIITGPSGDVEIKNKKQTNWATEKGSGEQCTCVSQQNNGAYKMTNRMTNRFTTNRTTPVAEQSVQSQLLDNTTRPRISKYSNVKSRYMPKTFTQQNQSISCNVSQNVEQLQPPVENQEQMEGETPLKGKERTLKEVLTNLHHDFEELNKRYEVLSQKTNSDGNQEAVQELEQLEAKLGKKEEEITMVMTLYKEVLALKQQVKTLKEKKSLASIPVVKDKEGKQKFKEYNNPEAAFHLTKLLRQIQHYQRRYKSNSGSDCE